MGNKLAAQERRYAQPNDYATTVRLVRPMLAEYLPADVIEALLRKYGLQNEKFLYD